MSDEERVVEREFTVRHALGLHARPAGLFVRVTGEFECEIQVARDAGAEWVSGRSILSLLSLAAGQGTVLRIRAIGKGGEQAVEALGRVLEEPLPESDGAA